MTFFGRWCWPRQSEREKALRDEVWSIADGIRQAKGRVSSLVVMQKLLKALTR